MKFRIGVDFDNTIACYDEVFPKLATILGFLDGTLTQSKAGVKEAILSLANGDIAWQTLQGRAYGKYMHWASIFPGFIEFLCLSKLRGHEVFIVSHKSEYGHFDDEKIPLRDAAMQWMRSAGLVGGGGLSLPEENIFFESDRDSKIARIQNLSCTHFIDDLGEVLAEPSFPRKTQKILFSPGGDGRAEPVLLAARSWREITRLLHDDWSEEEVCGAAKIRFKDLSVREAKVRKGRGNSRIYEVASNDGQKYALKVYPDRQADVRPRLQTEFAACQRLALAEFPIASPIAKDDALNWGVFRWISGVPILVPDDSFVAAAESFVRGLVQKNGSLSAAGEFAGASEACLSGAVIVSQIQSRMDRLSKVESIELRDFLADVFKPLFKTSVQAAKARCGALFDSELSREQQILSPSDFGAHNAILGESGTVIFIDFEYFGWDDPVKLVCDFYWHPAMQLPEGLQERWLESCRQIFQNDASFESRLLAYLPLYGLRWCLILLNEFLPSGFAQRVHADAIKQGGRVKILAEQLKKSKSLLNEISKK